MKLGSDMSGINDAEKSSKFIAEITKNTFSKQNLKQKLFHDNVFDKYPLMR